MCENLCDLQDYMLPLQTVKNAAIAQLVEHNLAKVGVASSSLVCRSFFYTFRKSSFLLVKPKKVDPFVGKQ